MATKPKHEFKRGDWNPVKKPGSLTRMAKAAGRSVHAEAEHLSKTKGTSKRAKELRGKGIFALNAERGSFKHATGPRKATRATKATRPARRRRTRA